MLFAVNQEQNESCTFKDMLLQPDKSYFILAKINEVLAHKSRSNWTFMKNSEVNNKQKKMESSRPFYPFGISSTRDSHMEYDLNTNPDSVHMEEFKNGELTTGKLMLQW